MAFTNQIGYAQETTYGTRVAPTRFLDFTGETVKRSDDQRQSGAIRAGTIFRRSDSTAVVAKGAAGSVTHEFGYAGYGLLLKNMMRAAPTISQPDAAGNPTVYEQLFVPGTTAMSLTTQVGKVAGDGVHPFDYVGTVVTAWKLTQEIGAFLALELDVDAQKQDTSQTLATASYSTERRLFHDENLVIQVNSVTVQPRSMEIEQTNGLKTDRYALNGGAGKKAPLNAEFAGMTGKIEGEFDDMSIQTLIAAGTLVPVTFKWTGSTITGIYKFALEITLAACQFVGETPETGGPGLLDQSVNFNVYDNGVAAPVSIVYRTTDSAV